MSQQISVELETRKWDTIPEPLCNQFQHLCDSDYETCNAGLFTVGQEEKLGSELYHTVKNHCRAVVLYIEF